jgi:hypothetical protein
MDVFTLCGRRDAELSLVALDSVSSLSRPPVSITAISDGTIEEDPELLARFTERHRLITRAEADEAVHAHLRGFPEMLALREHYVSIRKMMDVRLFAGERINYIDSDIVARRPFSGVFLERGPAMFASDLFNSYSFRTRAFRAAGGRVVDRLNAGLLSVPRDFVDLDFVEARLRDPITRSGSKRWFVEQTLWSMLAARRPEEVRHYDPRQVVIVQAGTVLEDPQATLLHFVGSHRARWHELGRAATSEDVLEVGSRPAALLGSWEFLRGRVVRQARRSLSGLRRRVAVR